MECSEKILSGSGEMELDPNIVSEEAGKLYSELQVRSSILLCNIFFFFILFCKCNNYQDVPVLDSSSCTDNHRDPW